MHRYRAFTLVEMLAVVSIMLILLGVTYGIFTTLAQQTGPDAVLVTLQAAVHNARDYAASAGVPTRLVFRCTPEGSSSTQLESSYMLLQYIPKGEALSAQSFEDVPGWQPAALPRGLFVCKGYPTNLPTPPSSVASGDVTEAQIEQYQKYEQQVLDRLASFALTTRKLKSEHDGFCVEFGAAGYPPAAPITPANDLADEGGLTVVRVTGERVLGYAFFPFNTNAGTRLIFSFDE